MRWPPGRALDGIATDWLKDPSNCGMAVPRSAQPEVSQHSVIGVTESKAKPPRTVLEPAGPAGGLAVMFAALAIPAVTS
jgi:hypothetical protein